MIENAEIRAEQARLAILAALMIDRARKAKALKKKDIAAALNIPRSRVSKVLAGLSNMTLHTLAQFGLACGVRWTINEFVPEQAQVEIRSSGEGVTGDPAAIHRLAAMAMRGTIEAAKTVKPRADDPESAARALENAHQSAANLLGEIAEDPDVMAAIRRRSPETADDIVETTREWKDAGETFLRSLHASPPHAFLKGSIVVITWGDDTKRRGVVTKNKPDEVSLTFEDDDTQEEFAFERSEEGWFVASDPQIHVQIEQE